MRPPVAVALGANGFVIAILVLAAALHSFDPDLYYRNVQEDEALEWISFWLFALAAITYGVCALGERRTTGGVPWFFAGLACFCGFVALEEISWGQRIVGYRPPAYFLEHNFQQEFNLHNLVEDDLRKLGFYVAVLGYGALLPFASLLPALRVRLESVGVRVPSGVLVPAFAMTGGLYFGYPWSYTGEWAEAMLGVGLLFLASLHAQETAAEGSPDGWRFRLAPLISVSGAALLLGSASAAAGGWFASRSPERLEAARVELAALHRDLGSPRTRTRCGIHKRLYTFVDEYAEHHLRRGEFAKLQEQGLPRERAEFFLDPWNSPYWYQHECSDDRTRRAVGVYSFGPNRRRDSNDWEFVADDLGAWVSRPQPVEHD